MADDKKNIGNFALPGTGAIAILLSLIGYFLITPGAFVDERPGTLEVIDNGDGYAQDIDARLWQDPFSAIKKDLEKPATSKMTLSGKGNAQVEITVDEKPDPAGAPKHLASQLFKNASWRHATKDEKSRITIIAAMESGGPYSEVQETRIRRRYALVSALSTLRYKPEDPEHIGYFKPARPAAPARYRLPEAVPFEWFNPPDGDPECNPCGKVLVIWLDDSRFDVNPIKKIREIFRQISQAANARSDDETDTGKWRYAVIGPNDSGQLSTLVREAEKFDIDDHPIRLKNIRFYPAAATAEEYWLLNQQDKHSDGLIKTLSAKGVTLTRTIADDRKIAEELVRELGLRGINSSNNHVVILSEWDTFYGRVLPLTFAAAYNNEDTREWFDSTPKKPAACDTFSNIHCFSYERGIDGQLPDSKAGKGVKSDEKSGATDKPSGIYDKPDGLSQKDYLRRLVDEIRHLDRQLIHASGPCWMPAMKCGVSAIGVLGYDVYDKLAILQALRAYFPGKLFFTTELDALYSSPKELPSTHNLIIASSFGLKLRPEIQKNIPPFRDSFQTAFFLSTLLAVKGQDIDISQWLATPRIFEIGRKGPVDLSRPPASRYSDGQSCRASVLHCKDIQPAGTGTRLGGYESILRYALIALGMVLLYRTSWTFRKMVLAVLDSIWRSIAGQSKYKSTATLLIVTGIVIASGYETLKSEEPWLWADGVSIWPSTVLRLLALMLSLSFLRKVFTELNEGDKKLEEKYRIERSLERVPKREGLKSIYSWGLPEGCNETVNTSLLWAEYRKKGIFYVRLIRSLPGICLLTAFAYAAILLSGGLPVPARGDFSFYADETISTVSNLAVLVLTMLIVDASRLAYRFIQHLDSAPSIWPHADHHAAEWGVGKECIVYWLDVRFIAELTNTIGKFIWYPIISLFLLVVARNSIFDNAVFSYGLAIALTILLVHLFSCAFWLQNGAVAMRKKAVSALSQKLRILRGENKPEQEVSRLQELIAEIENIREGAFTPFMQQPPVRAVLVILGGGSGLPFLDRFF